MFSLKNILKEKFQCIWSEGVLVRVNKISNLHVLLSRCTLINIVTSKHNVTETFFQVFFSNFLSFFLSYKGAYEDF